MEVLIKDREVIEVIGHLLGDLRVVGAHLQVQHRAAGAGTRGKILHFLLLEQIHQFGIALDLVGRLIAGHGEDHSHHDHQQQRVEAKVTGSIAIGFQKNTSFGNGVDGSDRRNAASLRNHFLWFML